MDKLNIVGKSSFRVDGIDKISGRSIYPQDIKLKEMFHAVTLRSTVPHATFTLNTEKASKMSGVVKIFTAHDVTGKNEHGVLFKDHQVFMDRKINRIGDPLALVVAETLKEAKVAMKEIEVLYNELPGVFCPLEAMNEDAPKIHGDSNIIANMKLEKGTVDFSKCDVVVENTFKVPMVEHAFLQPESAVSYIEDDKLVVISSTQYPHWDRFELSLALGLKEENIKVLNAAVGGAFGGREDITSQIHVALATKTLKKPVKITYGREESFLAHSKRHPMTIRMKIGALKDGKITAMKNEILADSGAYASWAPSVLRKAMTHSTGPYEIENVKVNAKSVYTNNPFTGAMRGFGATQVAVGYEQIIDQLAEELGISTYEIREKNILRIGSKTGTSQTMYNSVPVDRCLEAVKKEMEIIKKKPVNKDMLTGYGIALSIYGTGYGNGFPDVSSNIAKINSDGKIEIFSGFTEVGQGAKTVMAQIASEVFNTSSSNIIINCEDTDKVPDSGTAAASRQTYNTGNAVKKSCEKLKDIILNLAQKELGLNNNIGLEVKDELVYLRTLPSMEITFKDLFSKYKDELSSKGKFVAQTTQMDDLSQGAPYWPYGFNALGVKVEIDPATGRINVVDGVFAQDVGRAINPRLVEGQMDGGFVMGLGYALYEDINLVDGEIKNRKFSSYIIPTAKDMPTLKKIIIEDPEETGPFGAKGIGESVTIPAAPAILNAIYDASKVRFTKLPVTPIEFMKKFGNKYD
ncbi:xanthine dehydrogenase family protein [Mycoplasmatota bacterium]|nr:xanthine dehydrogenase family protein [Mycoplasmatota bacterium]